MPDNSKDSLVNLAVKNCKNVSPENIVKAKKIARKIYEIEQYFNVPSSLRGMTLAAACIESGYNPKAKGDRKFSKNRKTPKAIGVLQLWPWWEAKHGGYNINRKNPKQSTWAWMSHIVRQLPKVAQKCKPKTKKLLWIQAWVHAVRAPKAGGRCNERPKHIRYLKKLQSLYNNE